MDSPHSDEHRLERDLDVVERLERERCVDELDNLQLKKLFPNVVVRAEKMKKRHVGFTVRKFLKYVINTESVEKRFRFDSNYTLLFLYSVVNGSDVLAKHFFTKCDSPVLTGLMAAHMLR